jgi:hypothetical protein
MCLGRKAQPGTMPDNGLVERQSICRSTCWRLRPTYASADPRPVPWPVLTLLPTLPLDTGCAWSHACPGGTCFTSATWPTSTSWPLVGLEILPGRRGRGIWGGPGITQTGHVGPTSGNRKSLRGRPGTCRPRTLRGQLRPSSGSYRIAGGDPRGVISPRGHWTILKPLALRREGVFARGRDLPRHGWASLARRGDKRGRLAFMPAAWHMMGSWASEKILLPSSSGGAAA